ncbi:sequence-specific DNA binding transcription factors [Euphorbia peplus]|nr:sequence-specific DNA binding transcription factors [Euphorbia peplus]
MDGSGLGGQFLSTSPVGGLLDLEAPIHKHQSLNHPSIGHHHHHMNLLGGLDNDRPSIGVMEEKGSVPRYCNSFSKGKAVGHYNVASAMSEDDEPSYTEDGNGENSSGGKGKKGSPWQRMKWTDEVVRLLIAVVTCVGDDGVVDGGEGAKRKSGILQKKGKWKTVSKIMISKGCHVSPQQCEDKFNDLNKRYKRLNEILGRGTSCRVVENPALMDSMPQLSARAKDDVKKILSSKHLFYKEMCAYHNGQRIPDCHDIDLQGSLLPLERFSKDINGSEEEEAEGHDDSDEDDESNKEEDNHANEDGERMSQYADRNKRNEGDARCWSQSGGYDRFEVEMARIFQDPTVPLFEKKEWIKKQKLQLLEQKVGIQAEAFELEKQRFKWLRYCDKKDREFERLRLENERMRLENEQSILQMRQKQLEMDIRSSETSRDHASLGTDRLQGRDQVDLCRHK